MVNGGAHRHLNPSQSEASGTQNFWDTQKRQVSLLPCSGSTWKDKRSRWEITQTSSEKGFPTCLSRWWGN